MNQDFGSDFLGNSILEEFLLWGFLVPEKRYQIISDHFLYIYEPPNIEVEIHF